MAQEKLPEFRLCACGLHGRIICADGSIEMEVFTTSMARKALASAVERKRVEARHVARLVGLIGASGLTLHYDEVPQGIMSAVSEWNDRRSGPSPKPEPPCLKEGA
jgi:hypothetical protein